MYLNDFSVRILEGIETPGGYVEMRHGQKYQLVLGNRHSVRCDVRVEIDGKHVGTWRIPRNSNITLERPVHDTGHFTFYKVGTPEAMQAAVDSGDSNLGLIKVTFTPEKVVNWTVTTSYYATGDETSSWAPNAGIKGIGDNPATYTMQSHSRSAGGTGLSGHSGQQFTDAEYITYDYTQQTVIHLRLVAVDDYSGPRPLTSFSTPVPPRIG